MPRRLIFSLIFLLTTFAVANAQAPAARPKPDGPTTGASSSRLRIELPTPIAETPVPMVESGRSLQTLSFVTPDANFERAVVKDAAFSAESVTEHIQTLGDGNRFTRKSTAHIYRDAAGRTRREHEMTRRGSISASGEAPRLLVINDPIGRVNYVIETQAGTARKTRLPPPQVMEAFSKARGDNAPFSVLMPTSAAHRRMSEPEGAQPATRPVKEKLPAQVIEGVLAEGTRTTLTIPAGEFDNEQPLNISHEEWYAPELHMIVLMKHNDPRFGETTFRLTNINRSEPAAELFQLPPGYRVIDDRQRELRGPGEPPIMRRPPPQ
ncbi:MAG TPA: hypothetical protein VGW76_04370 [Pyrinomonadaceae bacterium]|nr:hypothetical protein [Pyrinomonadaceae bacterium]